MRMLATIAALSLAGLTGAAALASSSRAPRTVPCDEIVGWSKSGQEGGWRVVLDSLSVAPAYLRGVVQTNDRPWAYWRKAGLLVRAGHGPISVRVPRAWRNRVAITWGSNTGIVSSLRIASCPVQWPGRPWNGFAGGFFLRSRSACVPLIFQVGERSRTIRFGIGRRCGTGG